MSDIKESIRKLEKAILEDGKVDRAEAQILLAFAKPRAVDSAEMAEFVKALEDVLEDGVVTPEESVRIGAHLKWLTREAESNEPETSFIGRLFKLKRNRTTVRTEIVAGITTFMTMAYILAVNPNILAAAGIQSFRVVAILVSFFVGVFLIGSITENSSNAQTFVGRQCLHLFQKLQIVLLGHRNVLYGKYAVESTQQRLSAFFFYLFLLILCQLFHIRHHPHLVVLSLQGLLGVVVKNIF